MRKQETIEQYRRIIGVLDDEITEIEKSAVEEIMSIMTRTVDKTGREFRVALWARFGDNNEIGVFSVEQEVRENMIKYMGPGNNQKVRVKSYLTGKREQISGVSFRTACTFLKTHTTI